MDIALSIGLMALLIFGNGYYAMSEMALVSSKKMRLEARADQGDKRSGMVLNLLKDENAFLSTIQVAITFLGFGASAASTRLFADELEALIVSSGISMLQSAAPVLSVVIITLIISYITLIFGELVPKRIALANPEKVSGVVVKSIEVTKTILKPFVILLSASTNFVTKLLRIKPEEGRDNLSEAEIRYIVSEQDSLMDQEKSIIHEVFNAGDTIAREIMTPRVDMEAVEDTSTVFETLDVMSESGFSRVPVYHEDFDRIVGIAHIKDLLDPVSQNRGEKSIKEFMREPVYVPDTKDILPLLSEMQTGRQQMVIALDEHGGTSGIITIEDIVEEIVGEIEDEFDPDNKYLTQFSPQEWLVDGRFPISDAIELGIPIEDTGEYETLAGWILDLNDSLPEIGQVFHFGGYSFKIQSMRGRRIALIRVTSEEPIDRNHADSTEQEDDFELENE